MTARLAFAIETAFVAGRSTLALFQTSPEVREKADSSPVTLADEQSERIIRERIAAGYPNETVLGEEQGLDGASASRWVIDPIDGTKSFVAGVPLYATLLSYEVDGDPTIAVCYFPALDDMIWAEKGTGAYWNGRRCQVAPCEAMEDAVLCSGSYRSLVAMNRFEGWRALAEQAKVTRGWSDAYGHALVATGRAHAMIDPVVSRWDVSSPSLIVREAGGNWMDFDGGSALADEAVSCAPGLRDTILGAFRS